MLDRNLRVEQDFVQGNKTTIERLVVQLYGSQASPTFSDAELQTQLAEYLRYIRGEYQYLDFKGIDGIAEAVKGSSGLTLESVYVPLRARQDWPDGESWHRLGGRFYCGSKAADVANIARLEQEMARAEEAARSVEQWIEDSPALLILGDPGSGKSTVLKRLALGLAQCQDAPLPILLPLNAYSKALEKQPVSFEEYLPEYFHAKLKQLDKHKLQRLFSEALQQQKAVILMDGLDEVGDNRGLVVTQVENFVRTWIADPQSKKDELTLSSPHPGPIMPDFPARHPSGKCKFVPNELVPKGEGEQKCSNRMVVTSRFVGYRDYPLRDPRWRNVALNDWNRGEIERFFSAFTLASELAWSGGENRETAVRQAEQECLALLRVIDHSTGIRRLAGNPLLASLLALIKRQGVTLPHRRVELYKLYMETLLRSWNRARSLDKQPIGPDIDFSPTQRLLAKLALHLRQTNPQGGLIHEDAMRDFLIAHYEADGYSHKEAVAETKGFLDSVHKYSNLLIEKGQRQYGFIHLTFEEYLAGFGLALLPEAELQQKVLEYLQKPEHWRETLLLCFGIMYVVNDAALDKAQALLIQLLSIIRPDTIYLADKVWGDIGDAVLGKRMISRIQQALLALGQSTKYDISIRRQAGLRLGDTDWSPEDLDVFIKIPKGEFLLGEKNVKAEILQDYWIAKYPVTNAQYRCFVEAGGYARREYWTDEAWQWRKKQNWQYPLYWQDGQFNNSLSPVVGVSWFEALAYASWLQEQVQAQPSSFGLTVAILANRMVCLPTSEEWERAARGIDGRAYPWGNEFYLDAINCNEVWNKAGSVEAGTSAVCLFAQGVSADGLWDCVGNVWEWSLSNDGLGCVLRGGSWIGDGWSVRSACHRRYVPGGQDSIIGFRLALGPPAG